MQLNVIKHYAFLRPVMGLAVNNCQNPLVFLTFRGLSLPKTISPTHLDAHIILFIQLEI